MEIKYFLSGTPANVAKREVKNSDNISFITSVLISKVLTADPLGSKKDCKSLIAFCGLYTPKDEAEPVGELAIVNSDKLIMTLTLKDVVSFANAKLSFLGHIPENDTPSGLVLE